MTQSIWRKMLIGGLRNFPPGAAVAMPVSAEAIAVLVGYKDGVDFLVETRVPRNIDQLRLFWKLCDIVVENDEQYVDRYQVREDIFTVLEQQHPGKFMETRTDRWGCLKSKPVSIAFESMKQDEFNTIFTRCLDIVCQWLDTQPKALRDEVYAILDKGYSEMRRR